MFNRRGFAGVVMVAALAASNALAQGQAIVGIGLTTSYTIDGRIAAVDVPGRSVTLVMPDSSQRTVKVSQAVATLSSTKIGDIVTASFVEKRTFVLSGPNTKTPGDSATGVAAVGRAGSTSGAVVAGKTVTTWWVTAVDPAAKTISLVDPAGGQVRTFTVQDAAAQANLPRVKTGDALTAIETDIVVVSLAKR
jgi:hypothetical protein